MTIGAMPWMHEGRALASMKNLSVIGYFTSEIGATKALRFLENPGAYRGDELYHKGDRAYYNPARRIG